MAIVSHPFEIPIHDYAQEFNRSKLQSAILIMKWTCSVRMVCEWHLAIPPAVIERRSHKVIFPN
jgi:hypothetical protein